MRQVRQMIFFGNGMESMGKAYMLMRQLDEGFTRSSYMQQTLVTDKIYKRDMRDQEDLVKDIAMALTGREIEFTDKKKKAK